LINADEDRQSVPEQGQEGPESALTGPYAAAVSRRLIVGRIGQNIT